ncbi:MAG TPA: dienelactone hydrolase family protein [Mycobacterium sp.]|jgi:carboxymethylenebutenolidase|uniref:dienelactone hydrolase family protein n=1 Tax=Mycobacterium sp. TaxID=1785 RepID=UPI002F40DA85
MTSLQQYIAEEIATDHVDGLLTRREAIRRLALLGLGGGAAATLIAACADHQTRPLHSSSAEGVEAPGANRALPTEPITWPGPRGELHGAWAQAHNARRGVLVIHENKGLNDWVRSVAERFAGAGYSALAIDLLSEEGGTGHFSDPAQATAALAAVSSDRFVADLNSGIEELQTRVPGGKIAVVGFCFGGGLVWQLLASGVPQLSAAVPFYGPLPDNPDFAESKRTAVLAIYAALDKRVTSSQAAAKAALERAGLVHDIVVEPDADHAFFNDSGPRYDAAATEDAWRRVLEWFGRYLA